MLTTKCDLNKITVSVMDVFWGACFLPPPALPSPFPKSRRGLILLKVHEIVIWVIKKVPSKIV